MPKVPEASHKRVVSAFQKAGFSIIRQRRHISMYNGKNLIVIPRANPVNTFTLKGIIKDAGLTIEEFKKLL